MPRRRTEVLDGVVHQDIDGQGDSDVKTQRTQKTQRNKGNEPSGESVPEEETVGTKALRQV